MEKWNKIKKFLNKKIEISQREATDKNISLAQVFFYKISRNCVSLFVALIDYLLLLAFLPVFILVSVILFLRKLKSTHHKEVFFIGLDQVIYKTAERALKFEEKGYKCLFFSFEIGGQRCDEKIYKPKVLKYSRSLFIDTIFYIFCLFKYHPQYIEIYLERDCQRQFLALIFSKINGSLVIGIERGAMSDYLNHSMSYFTQLFLFNILRLSHHVFYREGYMEKLLKDLVRKEGLFFDHNAVKIKEKITFERNSSKKNVLFLNGFATPRNVDVLVKAVPLVLKIFPDTQFTFVGARMPEEKKRVQNWVDQAQVEKSCEVLNWTVDPASYYEKAHVYVLPADLVFCNFSLLEAMERGVPPIVANVRDSDRIVEHGVSGFLCERNPSDIAQYIIQLLSDEELRIKMGKKAREKVINQYNSEKRLDPIFHLIHQKFKR